MKKILLISFAFTVFQVSGLTQKILYGGDSKEIKGLLKGPIYVLLTGDKVYDDSFDSAMAKYWKVTPYKILTADEELNYLGSEDNYFIAPVNGLSSGMTSKIESPRTSESKNDNLFSVYVFQGARQIKKMSKLVFATEITSYVSPYFNKQLTFLTVDLAIKNLNDNIEMVMSNKTDPVIHSSGFLKPFVLEWFRRDLGVLKTKTLLIDTSLFKKSPKDMQLIKSYKYKYQLTNYTQIEEILTSPSAKDYCIQADIVLLGGYSIYDLGTKEKIWSGEIKGSKNFYQSLNELIQNSK